MPSGRSGGGHFGGGSRSFGGAGHFGGRSSARSSSFGAGHFGRSGSHVVGGLHRPSLRWRPHTTVVFGRPVYFGAARAKTSSVLSLLLVLAVIAAVVMGIGWYSCVEDIDLIRADYAYYTQMAENADTDSDYQIEGFVYSIEPYKNSGKYAIHYRFGSGGKGYSFFVYDYNTAMDLKENGVTLALDEEKFGADSFTGSVPLDYMYTTLEDDAEYVDYVATSKIWKVGTFIAIAVVGALIVASTVLSMTAKKATEEQIAETEKAKNEAANSAANTNTTTNNQTWRCGYCGSLNDNSKHTCDGCGAGRQK